MAKDTETSKEAETLTRAFGHESDWGTSGYSESARTSNAVWVGSVQFTCCATVYRRADVTGPVYRQWLNWDQPAPTEPGFSESLKFSWTTDSSVDCQDFQDAKFYFEGQEVALEGLEKAGINYPAACLAVRMTIPGFPRLAAMAVRGSRMAEAFKAQRQQVNEPVLFVPSVGKFSSVNYIEDLIRFVCSGMGPAHSPLYYRLRELTWGEFELTPWELFKLAGMRAEVLMADLGRVRRRLGKLYKLAEAFMRDPHGMMGLTGDDLASLERAEGRKAAGHFTKTVPWFLVDERSLGIPSYRGCFIVARRIDSCRVDSKSYIPAKELGFESGSCNSLRQQMHPVVVPQKPPQEVEVKPCVPQEISN